MLVGVLEYVYERKTDEDEKEEKENLSPAMCGDAGVIGHIRWCIRLEYLYEGKKEEGTDKSSHYLPAVSGNASVIRVIHFHQPILMKYHHSPILISTHFRQL